MKVAFTEIKSQKIIKKKNITKLVKVHPTKNKKKHNHKKKKSTCHAIRISTHQSQLYNWGDVASAKDSIFINKKQNKWIVQAENNSESNPTTSIDYIP